MSRTCCLLAVLAGAGTARPADEDAAGRATLAAAAAGFRANLRAAAHFRCDFTITRATAASFEALVQGRYTGKSNTGNGLAVRSGDRWFIRLIEDAETTKVRSANTPATKPFPGRPGVFMGPLLPFSTNQMTTDGKRGLNLGTLPDNANLTAGKHVMNGSRFITNELLADHPLGFPTLAERAGRGEVRYTDLSTTPDGLLRVTFVVTEWPQTAAYTVDTRRGFLPVRWENRYTNDSLVGTTVIPDVAACGDGWFPTRLVTGSVRDGEPLLGWNHQLTNFDPNYRATDKDFEIDLPAGTSVCRFGDGKYHFRTKQPERVGHADFDRLWQLSAEGYAKEQALFAGTADPAAPRPDTAVRPRPPAVPAWAWAAGGAAVLTLTAGLVARQRRGRVA